MRKLKLQNFKAFAGEITLPLDGKSFLLYGENGAGKSSLYEAIKIIFYHERLTSGVSASTPEDLTQLTNEFWSAFNNRLNNLDFTIEINDENYTTFSSENYQVFMISQENLVYRDNLNLKEILQNFYFPLHDTDSLCAEFYDLIESEINRFLVRFKESVSVTIDNQDDFNIVIKDSVRNLESKHEIRKYFNEAKLNLIKLLILLTLTRLYTDKLKNKVLVLDDVITSLDSSNRTFVTRHILENFSDTQILLFTHNISFYNLTAYTIREVSNASENWKFSNLYEINSQHRIYIKSEIETVSMIKIDFEGLAKPLGSADIEAMGNRIRKKFEILLYEYSKLLMIGAVEDSNKILNRIINGKSAYYYNGYTASDLIDSIGNMLALNNSHNLSQRIQAKIDTFKKDGFTNFQKTLKSLKLYQKVTMHTMSHGVQGMPTFTVKEILNSIDLLERMEGFLKEMVDGNVTSI